MWRADMSIWIYLVVLFIHLIAHAESELYVSESTTSANETASMCNLATPDINFRTNGGIDGYIVSLDGANLSIVESESVWSGYVQTYAAFLYEGCWEEKLANSSAIYTHMYMGPGECYSKCKTDVIGMQDTTCHCNPKPGNGNKHATGCGSTCSNPPSAPCGGNGDVSIYSKVQYHTPDHGNENDDCRALYWRRDGNHFYRWISCTENHLYMCDIEVGNSSTELHSSTYSWGTAVGLCLQNGQKPAMELDSGFPALNVSETASIYIGQIRRRVFSTHTEFNYQIPGWRRGVITNAGGEYWLQFNTEPTKLKSLCVNVSTVATSSPSTTHTTKPALKTNTRISSQTTTTQQQSTNSSQQKAKLDDTPKFPMIAVYIAVPVVLAIIAVVVIVILCKRRQPHAKESVEPPDYVNSVQQVEIPTTSTTDVDLTHYETCSRTDISEHQYSALEHRGEYKHGISTNVDNTYENQIPSAANVYINT